MNEILDSFKMVFILMRPSIRRGAWIALTGIFVFEKEMEERSFEEAVNTRDPA